MLILVLISLIAGHCLSKLLTGSSHWCNSECRVSTNYIWEIVKVIQKRKKRGKSGGREYITIQGKKITLGFEIYQDSFVEDEYGCPKAIIVVISSNISSAIISIEDEYVAFGFIYSILLHCTILVFWFFSVFIFCFYFYF